MGAGSLLRRPEPPDIATFVDIDCNGLDPSKTVQLLINGVVRGSIPLDVVGDGLLSYTVPAGPIRNALADLRWCNGQGILNVGPGERLSYVEVDTGDSMELRYAP